MIIGSLCTGYGGLEMALRMVGIDVKLAFVADNDSAASKLLALRHPEVHNLGDIKMINWAGLPHVDILTAGYPCQPFSLAGQRKGTADERHLWPHVLEGIRALRPGGVLLENVPGHRSRGFGTVLGDLATNGYVGSWVSVRASDVGAVHRRERVFILARPAHAASVGHGDGGTPLLARVPATTVGSDPRPTKLLPTPHANCATGAGTQGRDGGLNLQTAVAQPERWGQYGPALERWAGVVGRPAPEPVEPGTKGGVRLAPGFVEWMMGLPQGVVTGVSGLSKNAQLRLLGNGVVPQQGAFALWLLLQLSERI